MMMVFFPNGIAQTWHFKFCEHLLFHLISYKDFCLKFIPSFFSDFSLSASNPGLLLLEKWAHEKHIRLLETLFHVLIQGPLKKCLP